MNDAKLLTALKTLFAGRLGKDELVRLKEAQRRASSAGNPPPNNSPSALVG